jgi:chaperonin GroES
MKIQPLGDRVLIAPEDGQEQMSSGGIIIPDTAKEKPQLGKIEAVGEGRLKDDGSRIPMNVKQGDTVFYSKYGGTEIKLDGKSFLIMNESDILGIVKR